MLGWGLNIVVGLAGLLDLGYVAFYAVGAYTFALLATHFGLGFWMCLPLAGLLAALWGIVLGFPVLRLRGDYLAIVTLAFGEIVRIVLLNWTRRDQRTERHLRHPQADLFRPALHGDRAPETFASFFGLRYDPLHAIIFLYYVILGACAHHQSRDACACGACRSGAPGRRCARTRSPAARSASTPPSPSSRRLPPAPCSAASPAASSPRGKASSARNPSPSSNPPSSSPSSCWAAWAASSASRSPRSSWSAASRRSATPSGSKVIFGQDFDPALYRMLLFGIAMVAIMVWRPRGIVGSREPSIVLERGARRSQATSSKKASA